MSETLFHRIIHKLSRKVDPKAPRLAPPAANDSHGGEYPPIFVIGCQRSGTSLVRRILDSHSRIACPGESNFILPLVGVLQDKRSMRGLDSMGFERSRVGASLAQFVDGFFTTYAKSQGKPRWADKTPHYIDCLPQLAELFPQARFVVISRHGLDVAYSLANPHWHFPAIDPFVAQADGDKPVGAGLYWVERSEKIESFYQVNPDKCYRIRYEELTSNPERSLRPLFGFLEEAWEPEVMQYDRFPHHSGYGDAEVRRHRTIKQNSQRHLEWPVEVQKRVRDVCAPMLVRLGYE